jgi:saccharopine dehydrogenase-like NADP-dependent oxidoreductase
VRWRLALPPKIADGFRALVSLGMASEEPVETSSSGAVVPRELIRALAAQLPAPEGPPTDLEILVVEAEGTADGGPARFTGTATFRPTPEGVSAGEFGTSIPLAIAVRWLAEGRVPAGVHPPETALPADEFLSALEAEGVELSVVVEGRA